MRVAVLLAARLLLVLLALVPHGTRALVLNASLLARQHDVPPNAGQPHVVAHPASLSAWIFTPFSHPTPADGPSVAPGDPTGPLPSSPFLPTASASLPRAASASASTDTMAGASSGSAATTASPAPDPSPEIDVVTPLQIAVYQADKQVAAFTQALSAISASDWTDAGLGDANLMQLEWMAQTSQSHRLLLAARLASHGGQVPVPCTYSFEFGGSVASFLDYMIMSLQDGVSGLVGAIAAGTSTDLAALMATLSVGTNGMLQILRQLRGLWPNPVTVPPVLPIDYFWSLASHSIVACPGNSPAPKLPDMYPSLSVINMPAYPDHRPALVPSPQPALTVPNKTLITLGWQLPGQHVGPFNQTTSTAIKAPTHALVLAETLALTVPLASVNTTNQSATLVQPLAIQTNETEYDLLDVSVNGTVYIALIDESAMPPRNLANVTSSERYAHLTFAGPVAYRAG